MLPSMPVMSTPSKERQDELVSITENPSSQNQVSSRALDLSIAAKKSPMRHVAPILKKYSSHRKGKGGKKMGWPGEQSQNAEKQSFRPIAPKSVMVVIADSEMKMDNGVKSCPPRTDMCLDVKERSVDTNEAKKMEDDKDSEDDLTALMTACTTPGSVKARKSSVMRKKTKQIRDMETSVALLTPDDPTVREEKSYGFAQAYFLKVKERLEGTDLYQLFLHTMNEFGTSIIEVTDLYKRVTSLLSQHPDLSEEFVAFLLPEQAMQCGKLMEYLMITKMRDFLRRLEIYFGKQPQQMRKFYSALNSLCGQENVTIANVRAAILPLLKGNSTLVDNFLHLLPQENPPESLMTEFEEMDFSDKDLDHPGEEELFETLVVPNQQDSFGGDGCACKCHNSQNENYSTKAAHCLSCGTRFIHGKVYLQAGKVLRPAKVVFEAENSDDSINRLSVKNEPRRNNRPSTSHFGAYPLKHARIAFNKRGISKKSHTSQEKTQKSGVSKSCRSLVKQKGPRSGKQTSARSKGSAAKGSQLGIPSASSSQSTEIPDDSVTKASTVLGSLLPIIHAESDQLLEVEENENKQGDLDTVNNAWTREEDKVILQMYKLEHSFLEISEQLPNRSLDEVKERFQILINIMKLMTEQKMEEESN